MVAAVVSEFFNVPEGQFGFQTAVRMLGVFSPNDHINVSVFRKSPGKFKGHVLFHAVFRTPDDVRRAYVL